MHPIPAIDLRQGHAVQLEQGDPGKERVRLPDPVAVAEDWVAKGAAWLHVVDLDRALGEGSNLRAVERILDAVGSRVNVQVGGGVRFFEDVDALLHAGAARVVVGTRAVTDAQFLRDAATRYGRSLVVAVDARDGEVVVEGWRAASGKRVDAFAKEAAALGVGGFLFTDVGREGLLAGSNVDAVRSLVAAVPGTPVFASGGIHTVDDLVQLQDAGAFGAVVGMAFYTGRIDFAAARDALAKAGSSGQ